MVDADLMKMIVEIDRDGRSLTKWETRFIADLIDREVETFTVAQRAKIIEVYERVD